MNASLDRHALLRRSDLGTGNRAVATQLANGAAERVYHGAYLDTSVLSSAATDVDRRTLRERARIVAAVEAGERGKIVSHHSAAILHGLPLLDWPTYIHFTVNRPAGGRCVGRGFRLHAMPFTNDQMTTCDGIAMTSLARTAVDVARSGTFAQALCVVDGALRAGVTLGDLERELARAGKRVGIATARRAVKHGDGGAENGGESLSRALMIEMPRFPMPTSLQREYALADGTIARVDFDWHGALIGEFDGRAKYALSPDAMFAEKRREDALRDLGLGVVRWVWDDLGDRRRYIAKLERALVRAGVM